MSRDLYKLILKLEKRVDDLEKDNRLLQNEVNHLETLLRLKDKIPERPFYPYPDSPWYRYPQGWLDNDDSITKTPYKFTCKVEPDSLTKIFDEFFK